MVKKKKNTQLKLGYYYKNGHSMFHTSKPENFNSLWEVIFIMTLKCCGFYGDDSKSLKLLDLETIWKLEQKAAARPCSYENDKLPSQRATSNAI